MSKRIEKLRRDKEVAEIELRALTPGSGDSEGAQELLARLPDLGDALRKAPIELKRQVFEASCLQIVYDKLHRRIEISATVTETIARALENERDLPAELSSVARIVQKNRQAS